MKRFLLLRTGGLENQTGRRLFLEFSIVNILPIQLDRGKVGNNIKEVLQKGEILK